MDTKVKLIHGFSHKIRLQILESIMDEEKTVSQIVADVEGSQSSISQHLACLRGCGLILSRQEGKYVYYRIRNDQVHTILTIFDDLLTEVQTEVETCEHYIG